MYIRNFHVLYEVALLDIGHDEFFLIQRSMSIVLVALTCPTIVFCNKAWGLVRSVIENLKGLSSFPPRE